MSYADPSLLARPLVEQDAGPFADLCACDPYRYLTLRMNLEVFGFVSESVKAWGVFTPGKPAMSGVMLRYSNTAIVADADGSTAPAFASIIDREEGLAGIRGSSEVVRRLQGLLHRYKPTGIETSLFMLLNDPLFCPESVVSPARRAGPEDLNLLAQMYAGAWSMFRSRANVEAKLAESRVYVVEEAACGHRPRRIVSCALLNIESRDAGLIGGVYTSPSARGKGYAMACTAALSMELQRDGKTPCLFYENPVAGRVYRRLGFKEKAHWAVLFIRS